MRRIAAALVVAALATGGLAACGGDSEDAGPIEDKAKATAKAAPALTAEDVEFALPDTMPDSFRAEYGPTMSSRCIQMRARKWTCYAEPSDPGPDGVEFVVDVTVALDGAGFDSFWTPTY